MKKIIVTTREYFKIEGQLNENAENLTSCLLNFCNDLLSDEDKDEIQQADPSQRSDYERKFKLSNFFKNDASYRNAFGKKIDEWFEDNSLSEFPVKKIDVGGTYSIYVVPCLPSDTPEDNSSRQGYIASVVNMCKGECLAEDLFIICHDKDIYEKNADRNPDDADIKDSALRELIDEKTVCLSNIYGFMHSGQDSTLYGNFVSLLPNVNPEQCETAIESIIFYSRYREKIAQFIDEHYK